MELKKLSVLQIGDVHIVDWANDPSEVDLKISSFSPQIISNLQTDGFSQVLEDIRNRCRREDISAAVMMGDFTSRGKTKRILQAIQTLTGLINDTSSAKQIKLLGVPGNHDVCKEDAVAKGDIGKFDPLVLAFSECGWETPPTKRFVTVPITNESGFRLPFYTVNSSIGSWSKALYPEGLREKVFNSDSKPIALSSDGSPPDTGVAPDNIKTKEEQIYEQLDTPYFLASDLAKISAEIRESGALSVVVAHHNLLPQFHPRVSHFGEVLNSGRARELFLESGCSVVYLHGHIHTDPVEVVTSPYLSGRILAISAPAIQDGYNVLSFFADSSSDVFAIKIDQIRRESSHCRKTSKIIPLKDDKQALMKRDVYRLWRYLQDELPAEDRGQINWNELMEYGQRAEVPETSLEGVVIALYCAGLIEIRNLESSISAWRIKAVDQS